MQQHLPVYQNTDALCTPQPGSIFALTGELKWDSVYQVFMANSTLSSPFSCSYILRTVSVIMFRVVFSYVIRLHLGCSSSWCHMIETPAYVCRRHIGVIQYVGTLCTLRHYQLILLMKETILYLFREKHFIIWDPFNTRLEAPLLSLGFRLLMNNIVYCCFSVNW